MRIDVRMRGEVEVVRVSLDGPGAVAELHQRLGPLLDAGQSRFILNMSGGPALDSVWLGELVTCRERVRKHGGTIKLVLTEPQSGVVAASRLDSLFEIFHDEEEALDSFVPWYSTDGIP